MTESVYTKEFEAISKAKLVSADGVSYQEFKKSLTPNFSKVWFDIFIGYGVLAAVGVILFSLTKILNIFFLILVAIVGAGLIGYFIAYIQLFFHEASHYNIAKDKKINDLLANIFIGVFVGIDIKSYRITHWDHHKYLGTIEDTEHSYFDPLNIRFIVESVMGIRVMKVLLKRQKHTSQKSGKKLSTFGPMLIAGFLFHAVIILVPLIYGFWIFSICWIVGLVVIFPFFASVRQVLEHRNLESDNNTNFYEHDHGAYNRIFDEGPVSNTLGAAGFNRHLLHHWEPQISYTRLKDLEAFLLKSPLREPLLATKTTYFKTFLKLIKH